MVKCMASEGHSTLSNTPGSMSKKIEGWLRETSPVNQAEKLLWARILVNHHSPWE